MKLDAGPLHCSLMNQDKKRCRESVTGTQPATKGGGRHRGEELEVNKARWWVHVFTYMLEIL